MATITAGTMRTSFHLALLLLTFLWQPTEEIAAGKGIDFTELNWPDALVKAKTENKNLFVYVYADWCGQCKRLKKTSFKDPDAAAYFNKNFVNVAINGETDQGARIMRDFKISSYPTLLIVDNNGRLKTKTSGVLKPYPLINFGRRIVP
ncbi:MAG TPA: thioredoxin family protein [Flavobacterium sp.]|jgi:thiol:disulfide interchange protein